MPPLRLIRSDLATCGNTHDSTRKGYKKRLFGESQGTVRWNITHKLCTPRREKKWKARDELQPSTVRVDNKRIRTEKAGVILHKGQCRRWACRETGVQGNRTGNRAVGWGLEGLGQVSIGPGLVGDRAVQSCLWHGLLLLLEDIHKRGAGGRDVLEGRGGSVGRGFGGGKGGRGVLEEPPSSCTLWPQEPEENFLNKCRESLATEGQRKLFSRKSH